MIYWLLITGWILACSSYVGKVLQPYADKQKLVKVPAEKGAVMLGLGFWRFSWIIGVLMFGGIFGLFFLVWLRTKIDFAIAMTMIFSAAWGGFLFGALFWFALKNQAKKLSVQITGQTLTTQNQTPAPQNPAPQQPNQVSAPVNTIILQPNYKPLVRGLIIAALVLGGYYFITELIKQDAAEELQQTKIEQENALKAAEAKAKYDRDVNIYNCLTSAEDLYSKHWDSECQTRGKPSNCSLPHELAVSIGTSRDTRRAECYKRYPEIK